MATEPVDWCLEEVGHGGGLVDNVHSVCMPVCVCVQCYKVLRQQENEGMVRG